MRAPRRGRANGRRRAERAAAARTAARASPAGAPGGAATAAVAPPAGGPGEAGTPAGRAPVGGPPGAVARSGLQPALANCGGAGRFPRLSYRAQSAPARPSSAGTAAHPRPRALSPAGRGAGGSRSPMAGRRRIPRLPSGDLPPARRRGTGGAAPDVALGLPALWRELRAPQPGRASLSLRPLRRPPPRGHAGSRLAGKRKGRPGWAALFIHDGVALYCRTTSTTRRF